ncbi:hypothetical protein SAY86_028062 [Trapa natans]|uniref:Uncharacterized protein n=1 Tax=Trapa natans TaxID=22666 RepID=A0AAN7RD46_TRANT|nr:hypothetical protein SAY86_028062 [Trapa natans]
MAQTSPKPRFSSSPIGHWLLPSPFAFYVRSSWQSSAHRPPSRGNFPYLRDDNFDIYIESLFFNSSLVKTKRFLCVRAVKNHSAAAETRKTSDERIVQRKGSRSHFLSEGRDEDEKYGPICPGCGVFMQDKDPNLPGHYKKKEEISDTGTLRDEENIEDEFEEFEEEEQKEQFSNELEDEFEESSELSEGSDEIDWETDEWDKDLLEEDDDLDELDGFTPAGVGVNHSYADLSRMYIYDYVEAN